jgi:hypothetical protein
MSIFRQIEHFSKALVVLGVRVQALVVQEAIRKTCGSLGG